MTAKAPTRTLEVGTSDAMSPLFVAVIEATEEAIYDSMLEATTVTANGHTAEALPIDRTVGSPPRSATASGEGPSGRVQAAAERKKTEGTVV